MGIGADPHLNAAPANLDFQPAGALFPLMDADGAEFGDLAQDIPEHGLSERNAA